MALANRRELRVQRLIASCSTICARADDELKQLNGFYASQVKQRSSAERVFGL
jgi:hypothetical protein